MSIEIRELIVRAQVGGTAQTDPAAVQAWLERLRRELRAELRQELRTALAEQQRRAGER
jgi:hypothetical protein